MTSQHLLTHTSGIHDYYDEESDQDYDHFSAEIPWCELETLSDYHHKRRRWSGGLGPGYGVSASAVVSHCYPKELMLGNPNLTPWVIQLILRNQPLG